MSCVIHDVSLKTILLSGGWVPDLEKTDLGYKISLDNSVFWMMGLIGRKEFQVADPGECT